MIVLTRIVTTYEDSNCEVSHSTQYDFIFEQKFALSEDLL